MRHFATESGKSKGQFYTPAEVSRIMAQIIGIRGAPTTSATVYNSRFIALMDLFMPRWQFYRELLNRLPVRHENWVY